MSVTLPDTTLVLFFDEPALVCWRDDEGPIEREVAIDMLSTALAATHAVSGVHVCGEGDVRLALDAGPDIVHLDVDCFELTDAVAMSRFLEGDGWVAWGAIPTHRPVGEHAQPLWKNLLDLWCELTAEVAIRCGCGAKRSSLRRAAWLVTARARPSARCCSLARSATACTITRPRRSSQSAPEAVTARR